MSVAWTNGDGARVRFSGVARPFLVAGIAAVVCALGTVGMVALAKGQSTASTRDGILGHLNAAIGYYRDTSSKVQAGDRPSDSVYQDNGQALAAETVRLAFQSARAQAKLSALAFSHVVRMS